MIIIMLDSNQKNNLGQDNPLIYEGDILGEYFYEYFKFFKWQKQSVA